MFWGALLMIFLSINVLYALDRWIGKSQTRAEIVDRWCDEL